MAYMLNVGERSDPNVEVHKFYSGAVLAVCLLALVFQAFLHKYGRWSELIDLPLAGDDLFRSEPQKSGDGIISGRHDRNFAGRVEPRQSDRHVRDRENHHRVSGVFDWRTD